jgi:hypothetical protein
MAIVLITEGLLKRSRLADGTILRDRMLSGFCVHVHRCQRTFRVNTPERVSRRQPLTRGDARLARG